MVHCVYTRQHTLVYIYYRFTSGFRLTPRYNGTCIGHCRKKVCGHLM